MSRRAVCDISISTDAFVAGTWRRFDKPFGDGPIDALHARGIEADHVTIYRWV